MSWEIVVCFIAVLVFIYKVIRLDYPPDPPRVLPPARIHVPAPSRRERAEIHLHLDYQAAPPLVMPPPIVTHEEMVIAMKLHRPFMCDNCHREFDRHETTLGAVHMCGEQGQLGEIVLNNFFS
jgi:hypothetical protein